MAMKNKSLDPSVSLFHNKKYKHEAHRKVNSKQRKKAKRRDFEEKLTNTVKLSNYTQTQRKHMQIYLMETDKGDKIEWHRYFPWVI